MIDLDDLCTATGGQLFGEAAHRFFRTISVDHTAVEAGSLFAVLPNMQMSDDGMIEAAVQAGAAGILCQQPPTRAIDQVSVVVVGDVPAALSQWAFYTLRSSGTFVVAVFGQAHVGMCAAALQSLLGKQYATYYRPVTIPGGEGLAVALGGLEARHQVAILELRPKSPDGWTELLSIAQPGVLVLPPLTTRHCFTGTQGGRWADAAAKAVHSISASGSVVLPMGDFATISSQHPRANVVSYDVVEDQDSPSRADIAAANALLLVDRVTFDLQYGERRYPNQWTSAPGRAGLQCALASLATALLLGVELSAGLQALHDITPPQGYLRRLPGFNGTTVIDHTGAGSLEEVLDGLEYLRDLHHNTGRRIAVVGDLDDQEPEANLAYQEFGQAVSLIDHVLLAGSGALRAARASQWFKSFPTAITPTVRAADTIRVIMETVQASDLVLITGSASPNMQRIVEGFGIKETREQNHFAAKPGFQVGQSGHRSWVEINLDALAHSLSVVRSELPDNTKLMADVRANAYGHGVGEVAVTALRNGVGLLTVGSVEEAVALRGCGVAEPILLADVIPEDHFSEAVQNDLAVSIIDARRARLLAHAARSLKATAKAHLKVDIGFSGYGLPLDDVPPLVRELIRLDGIALDGLYAYFGTAAIPLSEQQHKFTALVRSIRAAGIVIPHVIGWGQTPPLVDMNVIRAGGCLYGLSAQEDGDCPPGLDPILSWKSSIVEVAENTTPSRETIRAALIPVGYGDGFRNTFSRTGEVLLRGRRVPLIGPVAVNHCTVDISLLSEVLPGDEVVLIGAQGREAITAAELAQRYDCAALELTTSIPLTIPRIILES